MGAVILLSLGGGHQTWFGAFGIPFICREALGVAVGLLCAPSSHQAGMWYPCPLQHAGERGTGWRGGEQRDEQGHRVEAGKVVRTRSLNLN